MRIKALSILLAAAMLACCGALFTACGGGTADTATTAVTSVGPTTAAPTAPPMQRNVVAHFTLDDPSMITDTVNCTATVTADNTLLVTATGNNPSLTVTLPTPVSAADAQVIEMRIKASDATTYSQVYFVTDKNPDWSEDQSMKNYIGYLTTTGTLFELVDFYATQAQNWSGNITQLKLVPLLGPGTVEIDYIAFMQIVYPTT